MKKSELTPVSVRVLILAEILNHLCPIFLIKIDKFWPSVCECWRESYKILSKLKFTLCVVQRTLPTSCLNECQTRTAEHTRLWYYLCLRLVLSSTLKFETIFKAIKILWHLTHCRIIAKGWRVLISSGNHTNPNSSQGQLRECLSTSILRQESNLHKPLWCRCNALATELQRYM